ncbi:hypothetical protein [Actinoplanes sp. NPDC049316]|uniref:hypothetical protein n=1 Tax=Actinoplanes sp. NPDC049316 TaxID=3154727 RepID=UPI00341E6923
MNLFKRKPDKTDLALVVATVLGLAMVLYALVLTPEAGEWAAGVLVNLGSAVLLVVPIYLLNRGIDRRIQQVKVETATQVQAIADHVSTFEADVERRLEDVAASVTARLAEERERDSAAFDMLVHSPSRTTVEHALARAHELGLIQPKRGPRVCVSEEWNLYVRVDFDEGSMHYSANGFGIENGELIEFVVENKEGRQLELVPWREGDEVADIMVRIGRALERGGTSDGFDVAQYFSRLRDALVVAASHPDRRPIWQLCPPQWAVTSRGIVSYGDDDPITVTCKSLYDPGHWQHSLERRHLAGKPKIHMLSYHSAEDAARALHPEEPPF